MKTKSVVNALNKILKGDKDGNKTTYTVGSRSIEVIDQNGEAVCLSIQHGSVVYIGNRTIRNLIVFITDGLTYDQAEYLKTLRSMYSTTPNEKNFQTAKNYQALKVV